MSGIALALGAPLMLICRESVERNSDANSDGHSDASCDAACDEVLIVHKNGRPMTAATLAPIVRFTAEQVQAALDELVGAETLSVTAGGVYAFPNFWKYQESAAAARMRALREKKKRNSDGNSDANSDAKCDDKRTEDRVTSPNGEVSAPKRERKPKSKPAALQALEAALSERCKPCPPALSQSLGAKASRRVQALVDGGAAESLAEAAGRLVAAWKALGTGNAWKLLDVDPMAPANDQGALPHHLRVNGNGRLPRAPARTDADFADEADFDEQLKDLANG